MADMVATVVMEDTAVQAKETRIATDGACAIETTDRSGCRFIPMYNLI